MGRALNPRRLLGAGLLLAGVAAGLLGTVGTEPALRTGANAFVNSDRPSINAHNSPEVAVDPARPSTVVVGNRIDTPEFSCALWRSTNGGASWQALPLPLAPDAPNCYWPDVAYTAEGLVVLYSATGGRFNRPVGVWLQRYTGGAPDGPPTKVAGDEAYQARLAVDGERMHVVWVQAQPESADQPLGFSPGPTPIMTARSTDGGRTFSTPVAVSEPSRRVTRPSFVLTQGQRVVIGALDLGQDRMNHEGRHAGQGGPPPEGRWQVVVWRSDGEGFGPGSAVADDLVIPGRIIVELAPGPQFAHDPARGRLYAVWDAGRADSRDVALSWSDDGGQRWSPPAPVAPGPGGQLMPTVAVAGDGRVDVLFYDRRNDPTDVLAEAALASSWDGGATFTTTTLSDVPFDSGVGLGSVQGIPQLGSQLALVSTPERVLAFWADTRQGTVTSNVQDLALAVVSVHAPGSVRWRWTGPGLLMALCGLALVAWPRRSARSLQTAP